MYTWLCERVTGNLTLLLILFLSSSVEPPVIDVHPKDHHNSIEGSNLAFNVSARGLSLLYQWQKDETNISDVANMYSGATTNTVTILSANLGDSGLYRVIVSNPAGSVISNSANLTFG